MKLRTHLWQPSFLLLIFVGPGGHGPLIPPWIHYWCRSTTHEQHVKFFHSLILFQQFFQIYELCGLLQNTSPRIPICTWEKIENYFEKESVHLIFSNEESIKIKRSRRTSCCRNAVHLYSQTNKTRKHTRTLKHSTQFLFTSIEAYDQSLLQNTPPFGKLQIWDHQSLLRNTPPQ